MYRIFKIKKGKIGCVSAVHYEVRRVGFNSHVVVAGRKVYNFRDTFAGLFIVDMRRANFVFFKLDKSVYNAYNRELFFGLISGYFSVLLRKCDFNNTSIFFNFR